MSGARRLWNRITRVLAPSGLASDPDTWQRAQLVAAMALIIIPLALIRSALFLIFGPRSQGFALIGVVACMSAAIWLAQKRRSLTLAGNMITLPFFLAGVSAAYHRGGLGTAPIIGLGAVPLLATFIAGRRSGFGWTLGVLGVVAAFGVARARGIVIPDRFPSERLALEMLGAALFPIVMLGIASAYDWTRENEVRARLRADAERAAAQHQAALLRADRMASLGLLAAGVAHEANNPLDYVVGNLDLLQKKLESLSPEELEEAREELLDAARDARHGAERIAHIVRDLTTFARPNLADEVGPVDVVAVMERTLKIAANELRHRATLVREYDNVPPVRANEARLGQVFLNLILNATHAIAEGDAAGNRVSVQVRHSGPAIAISISDTGHGISDADLPHITEPFFTTRPTSGGTGLGLAVCKSVVQALNGTIEFESAVGRGTRVTVTLPATEQPDIMVTKSASLPRVTGCRVLVVDDDPLVRKSLVRALSSHQVTAAASGREAFNLLSAGAAFDVILCDVMMPDVSGAELYRRVAALDDATARRFVFLTGGAFSDSASRLLASLPNECLTKPIDRGKLHQVIEETTAQFEDKAC